MRPKLTPSTSVIKPNMNGIDIALRTLIGCSLRHSNITRKLKERYKGVKAKNHLLAVEIIPKMPEIVNNQTNPI
tara:strand:- start:487 stop:708 length:222 start_codon:yes stop_codon:yes gene_type:complete